MRPALIAAVIAIAMAPQLPGSAQGQAPQTAPKVQITFEPDGLVTLITNGATVREVLAEWTRLGGVTFVNGERLSANTPMSLQFIHQPEKDVMASLLRQAAGYLLGPRRAGTIGASSLEVVYILPTSNPSTSGFSPQPSAPYQPQPISIGSPDDEIAPVGRGAPPPPPPGAPPPGPQPAPEYRPATPGGGGVAVPVIAVPPPTSTPPSTTGRGGNPASSGS